MLVATPSQVIQARDLWEGMRGLGCLPEVGDKVWAREWDLDGAWLAGWLAGPWNPLQSVGIAMVVVGSTRMFRVWGVSLLPQDM